MSDEQAPAGVYDVWALQEATNRGPFWQQLQEERAKRIAAEAALGDAQSDAMHAWQEIDRLKIEVERFREALEKTLPSLRGMPVYLAVLSALARNGEPNRVQPMVITDPVMRDPIMSVIQLLNNEKVIALSKPDGTTRLYGFNTRDAIGPEYPSLQEAVDGLARNGEPTQ